MAKKVIISCAVTGAIHTPSMSEFLPVTAEEVIEHSLAAHEAGAAVLHLHARDEVDGHPTQDPEEFQKFLPTIHNSCDAVINITTGGGLEMTVEQRLEAPLRFKPEMCSLNMGSMNFALFPAASKLKNWKNDWEKPFLEASEDFIFRNTFGDVRKIVKMLGDDHGTKFEHECYDIGHLYNLSYFVDAGIIKPPFLVQSIFGVLGGIGPEMDNVMFMKQTADRLFGDDYIWSVLAAGRFQMPFVTQAAMMGGHVRVGLEDSIYLEKGVLAKSNADQVKKIRKILEELGMEIATPKDTRQILGLKGQNLVNF